MCLFEKTAKLWGRKGNDKGHNKQGRLKKKHGKKFFFFILGMHVLVSTLCIGHTAEILRRPIAIQLHDELDYVSCL